MKWKNAHFFELKKLFNNVWLQFKYWCSSIFTATIFLSKYIIQEIDKLIISWMNYSQYPIEILLHVEEGSSFMLHQAALIVQKDWFILYSKLKTVRMDWHERRIKTEMTNKQTIFWISLQLSFALYYKFHL